MTNQTPQKAENMEKATTPLELDLNHLVDYFRNPYVFGQLLNGEMEPDPPTDDQILCHLVSRLFAKREDVVDRYKVIDAKDRRAKAWKDGKAEAEKAGQIPLLLRDFQKARAMAQSLWENPEIAKQFPSAPFGDTQTRQIRDHFSITTFVPALTESHALLIRVIDKIEQARQAFKNGRWDIKAAALMAACGAKKVIIGVVEKRESHGTLFWELSDTDLALDSFWFWDALDKLNDDLKESNFKKYKHRYFWSSAT